MEEKEPKIELSAAQFKQALQTGYVLEGHSVKYDFRRESGFLIRNVKVIDEFITRGQNYPYAITLEDCEFEDITFRDCHFVNSFGVDYSKFLKSVNIIGSSFYKEASFHKVYFENNFHFSNTKVGGQFNINGFEINGDFEIYDNIIDGAMLFSMVLKTPVIDVSGNIIKGDLKFSYSEVTDMINLTSGEIKGDILFENIKSNLLQLSGNFALAKTLSISLCSFQSITFPDTFPDKFCCKIANTFFSSIAFSDSFTNLGYMQWNCLIPQNETTINIVNSAMGKWDIINCDFEKVNMIIRSSKITDAFYTNTKFPVQLSVPADIAITDERRGHDILRDGYNQLKTLAQKQNDRKMFLHYQAEELRSFYATLHWWKDLRTKLQLFFMWLSNDFGTNWVRAVGFTAGLNLLFLSLAFCCRPLDISQAGTFMGQYFSFLLALTTKPDFIKSNQEIIAFGVSRIFIAFGIYQTISAFRKFGKGES